MKFNLFQSLIYGFLSGLCEILPVSAQAHRQFLLTLYGADAEPVFLRLLVHLAILGALIYCTQTHIIRLMRQRRLARIPKKRRRRPVDLKSITDLRLLQTAAIPVILSFFLYPKTVFLRDNLIWIAGFLVLNGIVLFIPRFLPYGDKDSRNISRGESLLIGLGGTLSVLPGMSSVGGICSVGTSLGADRTYIFNTALLTEILITAGMVVMDIMAIASAGFGGLGFGVILDFLLAAAAAFIGVLLAVRIMRTLAVRLGFDIFTYYSWGAALFAFILFMNAV